MAEFEPKSTGESGTTNDDWVVGPDGITFHEHVGIEEAWVEEVEGYRAIQRLIQQLTEGKTLEERFHELARDIDRHQF